MIILKRVNQKVMSNPDEVINQPIAFVYMKCLWVNQKPGQLKV